MAANKGIHSMRWARSGVQGAAKPEPPAADAAARAAQAGQGTSGLRGPAPGRLRPPIRLDARSSEELRLILREIADATAGRTAILTMHPADAGTPILLDAEEAGEGAPGWGEELLQTGKLDPQIDGAGYSWAIWQRDIEAHDILMIPIDLVEGHGRLMVSVVFDGFSAEARRAAEDVYLRRRPLIAGYFRLWQLERARRRRIVALQAAINLTELGVVLIDGVGRLVFCNDAAARLIETGDGLGIRAGTLSATNLSDDLRLQVALGHIIGASMPAIDGQVQRRAPVMSIGRSNGPPIILTVLPTSEPANEPSDVAAILYLLDPAIDTDQMLKPVCKLFQLSPVETKLVCQLSAGATLAQAAEAMHVKEDTVRSCLKQVFAKTGTNRQVDLVRVMLSNLARTTRSIPTEVI
ncbi:MAG: hypothetical protein JWM38_56 [Sphingomonas bacterium]|nr:hypothetical protein [Sphingomonas bacterium]